MIPTLEQAVLVELAAAGPVPREMRLLAKDRADRVRSAMVHVARKIPSGCTLSKMATSVAAVVREEHSLTPSP